jgi:hypothetical protein
VLDAERGEIDAVEPVDLAAHACGEQLVEWGVAVSDEGSRVANEVGVEPGIAQVAPGAGQPRRGSQACGEGTRSMTVAIFVSARAAL